MWDGLLIESKVMFTSLFWDFQIENNEFKVWQSGREVILFALRKSLLGDSYEDDI